MKRLVQLICREALHRRLNSILTLLAVVAAVGLPVSFFTAGQAARLETIRLMRDLGYNLRIVPKATEMAAFWARGYSSLTMPAASVERFALAKDITYNHLIAILQRQVEWRGESVLLTGMAQEFSPAGRKQDPMIFQVQEGTMHLGFELAQGLGLKQGEDAEFLGRSFHIAQCLSPTGTIDDIRVYVNLAAAQDLLQLEGRINEIKALECACQSPGVDSLAKLEEELLAILPEGKVIRMQNRAEARQKQRRMADRYYYGIILPIALAACALWIAFLAVLNVRERRQEIGILRALGHGSAVIAGLFLGRALALGWLGAVLGFLGGSWLSGSLGEAVFATTAASQAQTWWLLLPVVLVLAPAFAAVASFVPAMAAVAQDPAETLRGPE